MDEKRLRKWFFALHKIQLNSPLNRKKGWVVWIFTFWYALEEGWLNLMVASKISWRTKLKKTRKKSLTSKFSFTTRNILILLRKFNIRFLFNIKDCIPKNFHVKSKEPQWEALFLKQIIWANLRLALGPNSERETYKNKNGKMSCKNCKSIIWNRYVSRKVHNFRVISELW